MKTNSISMDKFIRYRSIQESDFQRIKDLHEEFFPVRYNEQFFRDSCRGIGVNGGRLYTCLAVRSDEQSSFENITNFGVIGGTVVGFIFAQFVPYADSEDKYIIKLKTNVRKREELFYILTLGVCKEYRRIGLGNKLLAQCTNYANQNPRCCCIYLHVIHSNSSAIRFYEKVNFLKFKSINGMLNN